MNIDLMALIGSWYRGRGRDRFQTADPTQEVFSPYDIPTSLLEDMESRGIKPFHVYTVDLAIAGRLVIQSPGFHIVIYGHDGSFNKAVNSTAFINMWWGNAKKNDEPFPLKHARGYSGIFKDLFLEWPAQPNVKADIVVHSGMHRPWIDGEAAT